MKSITTSSPAKVILFGEHAVVHGAQAVVASLDLNVKATIQSVSGTSQKHPAFIQNIVEIFVAKYKKDTQNLQFILESTIPIGCCLGSSAATACAIFKGLLQYFDIAYSQQDLFTLVQESEKFAHGNPSGIDATAVVYEGVLEFQKKDGKFYSSQIKTTAFEKEWFFLIQSGKPKETTKKMIEKVQKLLDSNPSKKDVLKNIGIVSQQVITDLKNNQFNQKNITKNEVLLEELEVVGDIAKNMITKIVSIGGYAKVTGGAGYQKGSGMLLAYHPKPEMLEKLIQKNNWKYYKTQLGSV